MKLGTKSLLFGAHQFLIHPFFVAWAYLKLYGWPKYNKLQLLVACIVHDWGYWGCDDLDGPQGRLHPFTGAKIMHRLFDRKGTAYWDGECFWYEFMLCHSRTLARNRNAIPSRLCYADKLATVLMPSWLWVVSCSLSGESEYFRTSPHVMLADPKLTPFQWIEKAKQHTRDWFKLNFTSRCLCDICTETKS